MAIMSEQTRSLTRYLAAMGCRRSSVVQIVLEDLQTEEAVEEMVEEMVEFCRERHPNLTEAQLLEASYEISLKYPIADEKEN